MAIRTCLLQTHSRVNEDLYQLTLPNHAAYCGRHEYDMVQLNRSYGDVWFGYEDYILELSRYYHRILLVGSDVIFTRPEISLDSFVDDNHSVFIQEEGLGYPTLNFDVVLWSGPAGISHVIGAMRATKPRYEHHRFGAQTGITMLSKEAEMATFIKVLPPATVQGAPFVDMPGTWNPRCFTLHFLGLTNEMKFECCKLFLETGKIRMFRRG